MKHKWSSLLHDAYPWLLLLLCCDVFFILLVWLASPEALSIFVILMVSFSIVSAAIGLWITERKKKKKVAAFNLFLSEPSNTNESVLIEASDRSSRQLIQDMGRFLREQQRSIDEADHRVTEYEEYIEAWVHEIKTPLTLVTLLLDNRRDEMSDHVHKRFEYARREISEDVDRILYYARLQSTHIDYRFERIALSACCAEVLDNLASLFEEHHATITHELEEVEVVSDMKALQFIISQIIINSIKYAKPETQPVVRIEAYEDGDRGQSVLRISDNGIGVPARDLPFIFDKGFTGNYPNNRRATGMGLYLVKKFCDDLEIAIEVESEVGQGLCIQLLFPDVEISPAR
jgi:signal transduction histidine kinase